ncbi:MAG: sigma-70 family RNA polymerase sigma factor, partial [Acidimicrobiales bacterium]|nr:sigma-70 family RNA polymerase sigma factor [Acidimicrobiales bacterium]
MRGSPSSKSDNRSAEAAAFGCLFDRHAQAVYAFCARRTADLALAEDLTSITFLEAWRHRHRAPLTEDDAVRPWLLGVANNVIRNTRRGHRRYRAALAALPALSLESPAEEQAIARLETEAALRDALAAISALSDGEQEVVMLVLWTELSYADAAV